MLGPYTPTAIESVRLEDGTPAPDEQAARERWRRHFAALFAGTVADAPRPPARGTEPQPTHPSDA
eukprot:3482069-Lingulodinium_polyedra.AAC.1